MPCDTMQVSGVDLGKVDPPLLIQALQAMGQVPSQQGEWIRFNQGTYNTRTKECNVRRYGAEQFTAQVKRAYSAEVVKSTAKRFGWQLKQVGEYKYQVTKNTY